MAHSLIASFKLNTTQNYVKHLIWLLLHRSTSLTDVFSAQLKAVPIFLNTPLLVEVLHSESFLTQMCFSPIFKPIVQSDSSIN